MKAGVRESARRRPVQGRKAQRHGANLVGLAAGEGARSQGGQAASTQRKGQETDPVGAPRHKHAHARTLTPEILASDFCPPELSEKKSAREQDTPFVATSWGSSSKRMKYARAPRPKAFYLGSKVVHFQSLNCLRS